MSQKNLAKVKNKFGVSTFPWGRVVKLESRDSYEVSRMVIRPENSTEHTYHAGKTHRIVVVSGSGVIKLGVRAHDLMPGTSCLIPQDWYFQIINDGEENLIIIDIISNGFAGHG